MFQCNSSTSILTCSQQVSAEGACKPENALNTYEWTAGNVTAAQIGISNYGMVSTTTTNSTNPTTTSSGNNTTVTRIISETYSTPICPTVASGVYEKSDLIALGAGLGAGLGIPLLISTFLLIYCANARRREQKQQKNPLQVTDNKSYRWTGTPYKPAELRAWETKPELMGSLGRQELPAF
ncbi:hypothetical protein PENSUB_9852 [Penicillium subrubescens]|uniref:Mid2 domain-containing protein n=1 Tax=Penicillium subrubescens TaxID=1316194 RepID=A0A1Q5TCH3_9EURO|nr:hypothetical protein PENSUB_9852 [Penicillium subrubescens]